MIFSTGYCAAALTSALLVLGSSAFIQPSFVTYLKRSSSNQNTMSLFAGLMDVFNEGKKALVKKIAGDYDEVAISARIDGLISQNKVLMLSFTTCPYCIKAKGVLDAKKTKYTVVELDKDPDGKAIRAELGNRIGRTSVPAIWIDGQFVGGCNDGPMGGIVKLNDQGKLDGMLRSAGAL
jgi:glutaredoxin 3